MSTKPVLIRVYLSFYAPYDLHEWYRKNAGKRHDGHNDYDEEKLKLTSKGICVIQLTSVLFLDLWAKKNFFRWFFLLKYDSKYVLAAVIHFFCFWVFSSCISLLLCASAKKSWIPYTTYLPIWMYISMYIPGVGIWMKVADNVQFWLQCLGDSKTTQP